LDQALGRSVHLPEKKRIVVTKVHIRVNQGFPVWDLPGDFVEHPADGFAHGLHGPTSSPAESWNLFIPAAEQRAAGRAECRSDVTDVYCCGKMQTIMPGLLPEETSHKVII
jgi:hypothetical protein